MVSRYASSGSFRRDPVSVIFDAGAAELLARAYETPGEWVTTRLAGPGPQHLAGFAAQGINVLGPDNASTVSGRHLDYRTRWGRGFARSVFYVNKWQTTRTGRAARRRRMTANARPVEVEIGRQLRALGVIPAGRLVRIRVHTGGQAAAAAVTRKPASQRIFDDEGNPAARRSDPEGRDW